MGLNVSGQTNLLCLLGHPAKHSISPRMHTLACQLLGLDYVYLAFDVEENNLAEVVSSLRKMGVAGFNLTMPHKSVVIPLLDEITEVSKLTHAVNTVKYEYGRLYGTTTDGAGYIESLSEKNFSIPDKTVTILGAGGAAKPIIAQMAFDGAKEINIFKRKNATYEETVSFAKEVKTHTDAKIVVYDMKDMEALEFCIAKSELLTNATNVGMEEEISLVPKEFLRKDLLVSDIIYHPAMTKLLQDAKEVGADYINGAYMLLYQGAKSFEIWTGEKMPIQEIKKACFNT